MAWVWAAGLKALGDGEDTHYDPEGGEGPATLGPSSILTSHPTGDFGGNGHTDVGMSDVHPKNDADRDNFGRGLWPADLDDDGCDELAVYTGDFKGRSGMRGFYIIPGSAQGPLPSKAVHVDAALAGPD